MRNTNAAGLMLKWTAIIVVLLLMVGICIILIIKFYNMSQAEIRTENGIQEDAWITLGGIRQYIRIRGEDADNPVILMLHGGPGYPMAYMDYYYNKGIIDAFTMVSWDQRGSGRTYYENREMNIETDLSRETLLNDLDQLVDFLRAKFNEKKIIIMGHSWGTILGSLYANRHPEKVKAYIGVGQIVDFDEGKVRAAEAAAGIAGNQGETKDVEILRQTSEAFSRTKTVDEIDFDNTVKMITTSLKYLQNPEEMSAIANMWTGLTSPDMSFNDVKWFLIASDFEKIVRYEKPLIQEMYFDFNLYEAIRQFKVPALFISGEADWITPAIMVEEYVETLNAPWKKMVLIENAGHVPFLDKPGAFCEFLKENLEQVTLNGGDSDNQLIPTWSC